MTPSLGNSCGGT